MANVLFMPGCTFDQYEHDVAITIFNELEAMYEKVIYYKLCCGAMSADFEFVDNLNYVDSRLKQKIIDEDIDKIVVVCANCFNYYKNECEYEFINSKVVSVYEIIDQYFTLEKDFKKAKISIHDPCRSRYCPQLHESVRSLLTKANFEIVETKYHKELTKCCGNGAMVGYTNQLMKRRFTKARQSEFSYPIVTYCSQCQKTLKDTTHILNLLFK